MLLRSVLCARNEVGCSGTLALRVATSCSSTTANNSNFWCPAHAATSPAVGSVVVYGLENLGLQVEPARRFAGRPRLSSSQNVTTGSQHYSQPDDPLCGSLMSSCTESNGRQQTICGALAVTTCGGSSSSGSSRSWVQTDVASPLAAASLPMSSLCGAGAGALPRRTATLSLSSMARPPVASSLSPTASYNTVPPLSEQDDRLLAGATAPPSQQWDAGRAPGAAVQPSQDVGKGHMRGATVPPAHQLDEGNAAVLPADPAVHSRHAHGDDAPAGASVLPQHHEQDEGDLRGSTAAAPVSMAKEFVPGVSVWLLQDVPAPRGLSTEAHRDEDAVEKPAKAPVMAPHAALEAQRLHPGYDLAYLESIHPTHKEPKDLADRVGYGVVKLMRWTFDRVTGYGPSIQEDKWLQRILFLESVAGVPGMVGGMLRHLHSLRLLRRDKGWIPCLLEEAENERMHLLTFLEIRKAGPVMRAMILFAQGAFFNVYFIGYLLWPKACHAFVGYLEEEAVRTYTHALRDIDDGKLWRGAAAPDIAKQYWRLRLDATMRDVILAVRADEACHSHVNHTLKAIAATDPNPFAQGKSQMP